MRYPLQMKKNMEGQRKRGLEGHKKKTIRVEDRMALDCYSAIWIPVSKILLMLINISVFFFFK